MRVWLKAVLPLMKYKNIPGNCFPIGTPCTDEMTQLLESAKIIPLDVLARQ